MAQNGVGVVFFIPFFVVSAIIVPRYLKFEAKENDRGGRARNLRGVTNRIRPP